MKATKLLLAGEGGQGIQTIAKIITDTAFAAGCKVAYIPSFGVEQRGTPSIAFITISHEDIYYPRFESADFAFILQKRAIAAAAQFTSINSKIIFDSSAIGEDDLPKKFAHLFGMPAIALSYERHIPRSFNVIVTGKVAQMLGLDPKITWGSVEKVLGKKFKTEEIREANKGAFDLGYDLVLETKTFTEPRYFPSEDKIAVKGFNKKGLIIPSRCKGCGICIEKCPVKALRYSEVLGVFSTPVPEVDLEKCIACGNCFRFCPDAAIKIEKETK